MEAFKKTSYLMIIAFLFCMAPFISNGQSNKVRSIVAKVIDLDTNIFNKEFALKINIKPRQFYYSIYHFKVLITSGDTLLLAYVFDTKNQTENALTNFGIKKDSIYQFALYNLNPCSCDFPLIIGCSYKRDKSQSLYIPISGSVATKPYKSIYRILDYTSINDELWNELH